MPQSRFILSSEAAGLVREQLLARGGVSSRPRARDFVSVGGGGGALVPAVVTGSSSGSPWTTTVDIYANGVGAEPTERGVDMIALPLSRNSVIPDGTLVLVSRGPVVRAEMGGVRV